jgi:hypothetical protein
LVIGFKNLKDEVFLWPLVLEQSSIFNGIIERYFSFRVYTQTLKKLNWTDIGINTSIVLLGNTIFNFLIDAFRPPRGHVHTTMKSGKNRKTPLIKKTKKITAHKKLRLQRASVQIHQLPTHFTLDFNRFQLIPGRPACLYWSHSWPILKTYDRNCVSSSSLHHL